MSDQFEDLVAEAEAASVDGWDFSWLAGRATEERPSWGYTRKMAQRLKTAHSALDIQTGGGEVLNEAPQFPAEMVVTEAWPPNVSKAWKLLTPRNMEVIEHDGRQPLPFSDDTFDLATCRHPVKTQWNEISRVLQSGGTYFSQEVSAASVFELTEYFLGYSRNQLRIAVAQRSAGPELKQQA